jgi:hypothetical protein
MQSAMPFMQEEHSDVEKIKLFTLDTSLRKNTLPDSVYLRKAQKDKELTGIADSALFESILLRE